MSRSAAVLWTLGLIVSGAMVIPTALAWSSARRDLGRARATFEVADRSAREVRRLREAAPPWMAARQPDGGLAQRVTAVLNGLSLPSSTLGSLSVSTQTGLGGRDVRAARQRGAVLLNGLPLSQLGRFLAVWRAAEPQWVVSEIDLAPMSSVANAGNRAATNRSVGHTTSGGGSELPLRVNLVFESVFVED